MSITRILVPVDFSPGSRSALDHAVAMADQLDAVVEVLHVWEPMPLRLPELGSLDDLERAAHAQAERALEGLLDSARRRTPVTVTGEIVTGAPKDTILQIAGARGSDLIVMGTHGRTGVARLLMGSVAEHVVRHAACPVLTVHAQRTYRPRPEAAA